MLNICTMALELVIPVMAPWAMGTESRFQNLGIMLMCDPDTAEFFVTGDWAGGIEESTKYNARSGDSRGCRANYTGH